MRLRLEHANDKNDKNEANVAEDGKAVKHVASAVPGLVVGVCHGLSAKDLVSLGRSSWHSMFEAVRLGSELLSLLGSGDICSSDFYCLGIGLLASETAVFVLLVYVRAITKVTNGLTCSHPIGSERFSAF